VIAACGLVYELIAGAVSSYLFGDPVSQFSIVVGVFLCAMGIGSFLAKRIQHSLLTWFVELQICLGLIGGVSSIAMFAVYAVAAPLFAPFFYALCILLGVMVGLEIPILVRILERGQGVKAALSDVLALDYLGALVGALAFPFLVLPFVGLSRASTVFGILNLAVAATGWTLLSGRRRGTLMRLIGAAVVLVIAVVSSRQLVGFFEDLIYQDSVVYTASSRHQRIVLTRWRDDVRLYLDGHLQFSSIDEARYHEPLVMPAMAAGATREVLILGGGDGLAARLVLAHPGVEHVTLVDLDPMLTELARTRPELVALNGGSLDDARLTLLHGDAMQFLADDRTFYDVIVIDLPDPHSAILAKLYSTAFYALVARRLALGGVMVTQAGSPYYAPEAFRCIFETIAAALPDDGPSGSLRPIAYRSYVPSFGEWGFVMASRARIDPTQLDPAIEGRYLDHDSLQALFSFGRDAVPLEVEINRLDDPVLARYYATGWARFND